MQNFIDNPNPETFKQVYESFAVFRVCPLATKYENIDMYHCENCPFPRVFNRTRLLQCLRQYGYSFDSSKYLGQMLVACIEAKVLLEGSK